MKSLFLNSIIQTFLALTGHHFPAPADQDLLARYVKESEQRTVTPEAITEQNKAVLEALAKWETKPVEGRLDSLDSKQANEILRAAMTNYVAGKSYVKTYDPTGAIGFCFGRAMWTHLELLRRGVNKDSILKGFVLGDMVYEGVTWQFHVATMVRKTGGGWWIIDPEFGQVMTLEQWFAFNQKWSPDKLLRLYVTEAKKFGASAKGYDKTMLADDWYNSYFQDMLGYFREESSKGKPPLLGTQPVSYAMPAPVCRDLFSLRPSYY